MEVDFRISKNPGFLQVQGSGTISPSGIQQFFLRIPEAARDADTNKVLVDGRAAEGSFSTMQRFEYGTMLAEHFRGLQVAIVVHESLRDPKLFGETVAVNRGAKVRVFTNLEEAQSWLGIESANKTDKEPIRSEQELLEEILELSRSTAWNVRRPPSPIHPRAIYDLLERYIALHDDQASGKGRYQDTIDILKSMKKAIDYIAKRFHGCRPELDELIEKLEGLTFKHENEDKSEPPDYDDLPF